MWEVGFFFKIWFNHLYAINVIAISYLAASTSDDLMSDNVSLNTLLAASTACNKRNNYQISVITLLNTLIDNIQRSCDFMLNIYSNKPNAF